jgi:hypothetical protein
MAEKDLFHRDGNSTVAETLKAVKPRKNMQGNKYGQQSKAPFAPTSKKVQKGWSK